jgi:DNA-binding transcriptional LysR family regulator
LQHSSSLRQCGARRRKRHQPARKGLTARLAYGRLDLGLTDECSRAKSIEHEQLADAPLRLVVHPEHRFAQPRRNESADAVTLEELAKERFVLASRSLRARRTIDEYLTDHNFAPAIAVEANAVATILALVRSVPSLVAILPVPAPNRSDLRGLPLLCLPAPLRALRSFLLWHGPSARPDASNEIRAFRAALRKHLGLKEG